MIIKKSSLADKAYLLIEEMIVTLKLAPGAVISESELIQKTGIGRTPIREALQRLSTDRLVIIIPRKGLAVTNINIADHLALLETRRVLDRLIASRAAKRASPGQLSELKKCAKKMKESAKEKKVSEFMRQDHRFDEILAQASRNSFASQASEPLHAHCRRFWYYYKNNEDLNKPASLHTNLMTAVTNSNEKEAEKASDKLIDYLEDFTRAALEI